MSENEYVDINTLSEKVKAYLGALLHTSLLRKEVIIDLTSGIPVELAPTHEYREKIFGLLLEKRVLLPHAEMHLDEISICEPCRDMLYVINIQDIETTFPELMYPASLIGEDRRDAIALLQEIQLYEAIEYMFEILRQFHLREFLLEPRYIQLFLQILKTYSLGQLFNFIYTAVRNQAAYKQRNSHAYIPIANYIYKKIIDRFEKAEMEGWNIIHFNRVWGRQQSELSKLVCGRLLDANEPLPHEMIGEHYNI